MRLVLYTGKGGVGKTTTAAATALCAAERGRRTLLLSADAAHSLGDVLDRRLGPTPTPVVPRLAAVEIDARKEMDRHWGRIRDYLVSILRYQGIESLVAEELALLPGTEELSTLLAVEAYADTGAWDLIVLDCAPTDSTLRLVTLPEVAHGAFRVLLRVQQVISALATPLARNLVAVPLPEAGVFRDADRLIYRKLRALRRRFTAEDASVRIVVTSERMVIDEARRAFTDLLLFEVPCDAVVMNRLLPRAVATEEFFRDWSRLQEERLREVAEFFEPLTLLTAPLQDDEITGVERLAAHGREIFAEVEPDAVLSHAPRIRFSRDGAGYRATIPLPHASAAALDVAKVDDELVIRTGPRRRALKLPSRIARLSLAKASLDGGVLDVRFTRELQSAAAD